MKFGQNWAVIVSSLEEAETIKDLIKAVDTITLAYAETTFGNNFVIYNDGEVSSLEYAQDEGFKIMKFKDFLEFYKS